ncbi:MAG: Crp/Fnr family transcriptional regulator [Eubacteriales bacterium]|nr:Crp/Fnr family transcriptional regulator [Eubacteriales bacterium]
MSELEFPQGSDILSSGSETDAIGVVLTGAVDIERFDAWGNRDIINRVSPGQIFAESFALTENERLTVDAVAAVDSSVIFIPSAKLWDDYDLGSKLHSRLIRNMVSALAEKNFRLTRRMMYTSPKSIRGKVMSYLSDMSERSGSKEIRVPFNRQQMADFLGVDRSALSAELSRMKKDALIDYDHSDFIIL